MSPTPGDPDAWNAYLAEGNAKQARKRVAADVLLRDALGRVLLVDPTYKPGWDLPGGMAEANEPPEEAARRELREELGRDIDLLGLLAVDWVAPHGPWDDQIAFIFHGGTLDDDQALRPHDHELSEARFVPLEEARELVSERMRRRLGAAVKALKDGRPMYLRDGRRLVSRVGLGAPSGTRRPDPAVVASELRAGARCGQRIPSPGACRRPLSNASRSSFPCS